MRRIAVLLGLIGALLSVSSLHAQDSPDKIVRSIYATYDGMGLGVAPTDPGVRDVFSSRLQALLDEEGRRIASNGLGRLDFDIFVDGHDCDVTDLAIGAPAVNGDMASLDVSLRNFGEPRQFRFHFVQERGVWRIDEVESLGGGTAWRLSGLLDGR